MKTTTASPAVRDAIHLIVVGHMASTLRASGVNLYHRGDCHQKLFETGFGPGQIEALIERAMTLAQTTPFVEK